MSAQYNIEQLTAAVFAGYINAQMDPTLLGDNCRCVTFYDLMSIDQANRIVVMVSAVQMDADMPGNGTAQIEIGIKSQWTQADLEADQAAHWVRVDAVENIFADAGIVAALQAQADTTLGINFIQPQRTRSTQLMDGWIFTEIKLNAEIFVMAETT